MDEHEPDQAPAITPEPGIYTGYLAGPQFYKGAKARWAALPIAKELLLVREPANKFDKFAVMVFDPTDNLQLGHVPRYLAPRVSEALRSDNDFHVECVKGDNCLSICIRSEIKPSEEEGKLAPDPDLEPEAV